MEVSDGQGYVSYKGWYYKYATVKNQSAPDPNKPWKAWIEKPNPKRGRTFVYGSTVVKELWFAKRVSARKAALRWEKAHRKRIETQRLLREAGYVPPSVKCGSCEVNKHMPDDYLCSMCRHGY